MSPVADLDGFIHLPFVAGPHAAAAHDALGKIPDDHGVVVFIIIFRARGVGIRRGGHLILVGQALEFAFAVGLADEAVVVAGRQQQFDDILPGCIHPLVFRLNHHPGGGRRGAGRGQGAPACHFHHADPAGTGGEGPLHITERGDGVNAGRPGDFQDGLPGLELDGLAVYG